MRRRVEPTPKSSARDLAQTVYSELGRRRRERPNLKVLNDLFEMMYGASIRTEESQPITFNIVYLNPRNPDPHPPGRIVADRWSYAKFARPIPATIPTLVKLAKASDTRTSSLAVYPHQNSQWMVWGLVDQRHTNYGYMNYESEGGPAFPGLFQASIVGAGHIVAYIEFQIIAELNIDVLRRHSFDISLLAQSVNCSKIESVHTGQGSEQELGYACMKSARIGTKR